MRMAAQMHMDLGQGRMIAQGLTVEFTGLEMIATHAWGQFVATAWHRPATMLALMLNRSSRVIPGFRGMPASACQHFTSAPGLSALKLSPG